MRKIVPFTLTLLLFALQVSAQPWARITSFEGGDFNALYSNDSFIWVGSNGGGIYRSANQGQNYLYKGNGLSSIFAKDVNTIRKYGSLLVCGTGFGLHYSADNGENWNLSVNGLDWFDTPYYILEKSNDTLYTWDYSSTTNQYHLYWSTNPAGAWSKSQQVPVTPGLVNFNNKLLVFNQDSILLLHHKDSIELLDKAGLPGDFRCFRMAGYQNARILAKNEDSIFSYTEPGPWVSAMNGIPAGLTTYGLFDINDTIYTFTYNSSATQYGLYHSTDGGMNWSLASSALLDLNIINDLERISGGLVAVTIDGLWFLPDGGSTWQKRHKGIHATSHRYPFALGSTVLNLVREFGYTKSSDKLDTWSFADNGLSSYQLNSYNFSQLLQGGSTYFILDTFEDTLYRSDNSGDTWSKVNLPWNTGYRGYFMLGSDGNTIWVEGARNNNTQFMVFISQDGGNSWDSISMPDNRVFRGIVKLNNAWFLNADNSIYTSSDLGQSWTSVNNGLPSLFDAFAGLAMHENRLYLVRKYFDQGIPAYADSIFISGNNGNTWTGISSFGLPISTRIDFLTVFNGVIYISTNQGLFYTENNGQNWINFNANLPIGMLVTGMCANENTLYLTTQSFGMWKNDISTRIGVDKRFIPATALKVYPNPASEQIQVSGIQPGEKLRIIDLNGNIIRSMEMPENGNIQLNELSSGMYFLQTSGGTTSFLISR